MCILGHERSFSIENWGFMDVDRLEPEFWIVDQKTEFCVQVKVENESKCTKKHLEIWVCEKRTSGRYRIQLPTIPLYQSELTCGNRTSSRKKGFHGFEWEFDSKIWVYGRRNWGLTVGFWAKNLAFIRRILKL